MTTMLEPILIIFMAVVIGFIVIAMAMPINGKYYRNIESKDIVKPL